MIKTIQHKGLEKFFLTGSKAGIQPAHAKKLRLQLETLNRAKSAEEMNLRGWRFHSLGGDLKNYYSISVNGNWRVIFQFENGDAYLVDYLDYH
jgi:proteic killer suppression protein